MSLNETECIIRIDRPSELAAGLWGYTETVRIVLESGEPMGEPGEFEEFMRGSLGEWYDGASVEIQKPFCSDLAEKEISAKTVIEWTQKAQQTAQAMGATILMMNPLANKLMALYRDQFVVWRLDSSGGFIFGTYCNNITSAVKNYESREDLQPL